MRIDSILHNQHLTSGVCACENDDSLAAYTYLTSTPSSLPCGMYATDDTRPRTHDDPVVTSLPKTSHSLSTKTASFASKKKIVTFSHVALTLFMRHRVIYSFFSCPYRITIQFRSILGFFFYRALGK